MCYRSILGSPKGIGSKAHSLTAAVPEPVWFLCDTSTSCPDTSGIRGAWRHRHGHQEDGSGPKISIRYDFSWKQWSLSEGTAPEITISRAPRVSVPSLRGLEVDGRSQLNTRVGHADRRRSPSCTLSHSWSPDLLFPLEAQSRDLQKRSCQAENVNKTGEGHEDSSLSCQVGVGGMPVPAWPEVTDTLKFLWNPGCCQPVRK